MKFNFIAYSLAAIIASTLAINAYANTPQYPTNVTLTIKLDSSATIADVKIQNGHFIGAPLPAILPKDVLISNISQADNEDYALSFTVNNLCELTFYTPLGTEKHPLYTANGFGCSDLVIQPYSSGFRITSGFNYKNHSKRD